MSDRNGAKTLTDNSLLCSAARAMIAGGCSIIPIDFTTKKPLMEALPIGANGKPTWAPFAEFGADPVTIDGWLNSNLQSFALVCGAVSGGVCILDFDEPRFYDAWEGAVGGLSDNLAKQQTGGGGYQVAYRCPNPGGNQKLAWVPDEAEDTGRSIAIETRGEGGYACMPPSLHPSGSYYKLIEGNFSDIPTIPQAQADALIAAARKLDEMPFTKQEQETRERQAAEAHARKSKVARNGTASVIDEFNKRHGITEILEAHGYTKGRGGKYIRPGGESESVSILENRSIHFSTDDPLNDGKVKSGFGVHDAFDIFAHFDHAADASKAVKAAAELMGMSLKQDGDTEVAMEVMSLGALVTRFPQQRPYRIHGIVREGETANVVAASKVGKTFLGMGLVVCVAAELPWLNQFRTEQCNCLYIDYELHPESLSYRFRRVADAHGVDLQKIIDRIDIISLRGQNTDIYRLDKALSKIEWKDYRIIIIDALYRTLPEGTIETDNAQMTAIYNLLDKIAKEHGATVVVIHHGSKGNQSAKEITDVGSGAGSISRAADTHIVLRAHEEDFAVVMEAAIRSSPPLKPLCLRWSPDTLIWTPDPFLDPKKLKRDPSKGGRPRKDQPIAEAKPTPIDWTAEKFTDDFVTQSPQKKEVIESMAARAGLSARRVKLLLAEAEARALLFRHRTGTTTGVAYSTCEPDLVSEVAQVRAERECARTPPHPPVRAATKRRRT